METLHAEFRIVNHFPTAVQVSGIAQGCACADVSITPERLEPGEAAILIVGWRTGGRRGRASEVVTVLAAQVGSPPVPCPVQARLTAEVQPDVLCEPAEVRFERDKPGTVILRFTPGQMPDVQIRLTHATVTALQTSIDPTAGTVTVHFDPAKLNADEFVATVMVQTTSPKEPWVAVPVTFTGAR